jgi:lipid-binding SYLF domain-containing protein
MFMTQDALDRLTANKGWTAGADASVAVLHVGAGGSKLGRAAAVNAFAFSNEA